MLRNTTYQNGHDCVVQLPEVTGSNPTMIKQNFGCNTMTRIMTNQIRRSYKNDHQLFITPLRSLIPPPPRRENLIDLSGKVSPHMYVLLFLLLLLKLRKLPIGIASCALLCWLYQLHMSVLAF